MPDQTTLPDHSSDVGEEGEVRPGSQQPCIKQLTYENTSLSLDSNKRQLMPLPLQGMSTHLGANTASGHTFACPEPMNHGHSNKGSGQNEPRFCYMF